MVVLYSRKTVMMARVVNDILVNHAAQNKCVNQSAILLRLDLDVRGDSASVANNTS